MQNHFKIIFFQYSADLYMLAVYQPVFLVGVSNFFFLVVILGQGWRDPPLPVPSRWSRAFRPCLCVSIWKDDIHHISPLTLRPLSLVPMSLYMKFFVFEGVPKSTLSLFYCQAQPKPHSSWAEKVI